MTRPARSLRMFLSLTIFAAGTVLAKDVPYLSGRVVDEARILSAETSGRIDAELRTLEQKTSAQVAVLTVENLDGEAVEDYAIKVASTWKLGQKGKDNGVLFLIAKNDRKMRIEVGYGLEGNIPDALAKRILDGIARPAFRAGDFSAGIEKSISAITALIQGANPDEVVPAARKGTPAGLPFPILFIPFLLFFMLAQAIARRNRGRGWSSSGGFFSSGGFSGGGGGGFSGGGGSFGGGGASSGW
jgi:uncharacterized protein